jgi:hypothetical protein
MEIRIIINDFSYTECYDFNKSGFDETFYSVFTFNHNKRNCCYIDKINSDFILSSYIQSKIDCHFETNYFIYYIDNDED